MSISHETRAAIDALPGKSIKPWQDGDTPCHCTHCDLCGRLFRTSEIGAHEVECQAALLAALERARVVGVLDAWAMKDRGDKCHESWTCMESGYLGTRGHKCCLSGYGGSIFYGPTPDAARAAAAKAIEAGEV